MLHGVLAASVTPLRDGGTNLDEEAFEHVVEFLATHSIDGLLAMGTNGEGILLSVDERRLAAEFFQAAARGRLQLAVHCGAQSTDDTVTLAAHAAELGADAVAVISPPYFPLDEAALLEHFTAAAHACAPLPFYVYEFERASGYPVPLTVLARLRENASNLAGLKVSDRPWEKFAPYLIEGLHVFVGPESMIAQGLSSGAVGVVSALAAAFPLEVVAAARGEAVDVGGLRELIESRFPRHAALKHVLVRRGVPVKEDVRRPLRPLTPAERDELDALLTPWLENVDVQPGIRV